MADEEAEKDRGPEDDVNVVLTGLTQRLQELQETTAKESQDYPVQSSFNYCQDFCRALLESAGRWRIEDEPLPVVQVYMIALQSYAETSSYLSMECDSVPLVVERLALSFMELLLSQKELPEDLWNDFKSCVLFSHSKLQENGITQLSMLWTLGQQEGVWTNPVLQSILSGEEIQTQQIEQLLVQEGPCLLEMRVKQLIKDLQLEKAARLAKCCSESALCEGKPSFKQMYLVCLCTTIQQEQLMEELSKVDCRDALEMICNLESDGDEKGAFTLCSAFLSRQLLQADVYCAWELTLFWSKLLKRLEPSEKAFLDKCSQMSLLSKTVYHILFLIKVIQSEINEAGLSVCIEMCIRALRMQTEDGNTKATVCKTIACLLPNDLEVKRACQLTQFLLEPTVDSFYAVETLYNEPDQKLDEEKMAVPNSLRCELLLVFKTQWPFDPEFWDWKMLKRRCVALMGEEASIVSSIDTLNDSDDDDEDMYIDDGFLESADRKVSGTYELKDKMDKKEKTREMKKLREKGFISARFRNWQVYMQYCVLCDKEFLGHRIIRHAQTHIDRGVYSCPICTQSFNSKDTLIPHVTSHVKQSSKDRLTAIKASRKLSNPKTAAPMMASLIGKMENEVSEGPLGKKAGCFQNSHARVPEEPSDEVVCPVAACKKTFKFYRNLMAHVKAHRDSEEAKSYLELQSNKIVCQYCRRHFVSVHHLSDHLQVHCGTKPYICIQLNCKAEFLSNTELLMHRKTHSHFKARCMFPNCGKIFTEAFKLYDHEAKHYKTFTCKFVNCGRVFHTQQQLDLHHKDHTIKKETDNSTPKEQSQESNLSLDKTQAVTGASILKETEKSLEKCRAETVSVGKPETLENLLKASQTPIRTVDRYEIKAEVQDEVPISESNQSVNIQIDLSPHDLYCQKEISSSQTPDHVKCPSQNQKHISPFEATINKMLREKTVLQSELQFFSSNFKKGLIKYGDLPASNATMPTVPPQTSPIPMPTTQSIPMEETPPVPEATHPPISVAAPPPIPMAETPPLPMVSPSPMPMVSPSPIPMASPSPIPMASPSPIPMASPSPICMAATPPIATAAPPPVLLAAPPPVPMAAPPPVPMAAPPPRPMVAPPPRPMAAPPPRPMGAPPPRPMGAPPPRPLAAPPPRPLAAPPPRPLAAPPPRPLAAPPPRPLAAPPPRPLAAPPPRPMAAPPLRPMAAPPPRPMAAPPPRPMAAPPPRPMAAPPPRPMAAPPPRPMDAPPLSHIAAPPPRPMATPPPVAPTPPISMGAPKPMSMVAPRPISMAATQPISMAATQPVTTAAAQSIPVPATQILPTAEQLQTVPPAEATSSATQQEKMVKPTSETVLRERYHCPFDMCTRNYSCYKSVSKHIKTSHPDMYAIRRIPRCEIRVTYVQGSPPAPKPLGGTQKPKPQQQHQTPKVLTPHSHTDIINSTAEKLLPTVNTTGPQLMEKVLNPIVVAQLKTTTTNQSSLQTLNQTVFPMATQQEKFHKCDTAVVHLPRPSESIPASIVPKDLADSNTTVTNSTWLSSTQNGLPTPTSGALLPPNNKAMWSTSLQDQKILCANSQIHPTRHTPSEPSISIDPNLILANSVTKAQKNIQSTALYRSSSNTVLPPKIQTKTEEETLPLWSPASEISNVQLGTPPKLPNRAMGATSVSIHYKDNPRGIIMGSENQTSVICNPTSTKRSVLPPPYTPPLASPNSSRNSVGQRQTPKTCQPTLSPLNQNAQITSAKHQQMLLTAKYNTNVPLPPKGPPHIPGETNDNTSAIPATSMQISYKPPLSVEIKTEDNCRGSSHFTLHRDSTDLNNTNIEQHLPSQPLQNPVTSDNTSENCKSVKKRNRVRWPAIVKDGKVFCPRCYRSFSSTKSLGGHLSKRLKCNPFDEMELNSDLPASFLDLLNSDQSVSDIQQNNSINPHDTYQNQPHTSKSHGSTEQTSYRSQKCQDHLDGDTSHDTLQQIMAASNMADLCVPPQSPRLQKSCIKSGNSFQSSPAIQSVEGGVQEVGPSSPPQYPHPRPPSKRYPTPLLSQALKENQTTASTRAIIKCQSEMPPKDQVKVSSAVTPNVHPKRPITDKAKQSERRAIEQNIKKKLREQILAGDFQRRNNLSHLPNACLSFDSQSPKSCSSESSSKNEDCLMNWDTNVSLPTPAIIPGTATEIEELLKTHSFTRLRQNSGTTETSQHPRVGLGDDLDSEPQQLSLSQQQWFSELQLAFESLNLVKEPPEPVPDPVPVGSDTLLSSSSKSSAVPVDDSQTPAVPKIFSCVSENCTYITLSSAAFWRHLNKVHDFGFEQINMVKQKYGHSATFQCQKCPRTFTRNPNLKTHYISVHQLSFEEIEELDQKRRQDKAAMSRIFNVQAVAKQEITHPKVSDVGGTSVIQSLASANMQSLALKQTGHSGKSTTGNGTNGHPRTKSNKSFPNGCQSATAHLPQTEISSHEAKRPLTAGKQANRPAAVKSSNDLVKKTDKKSSSSDALSQYKPYRCVHKDCEAAFTIQHNLILHYRAVHQSALSALEVNKEQDQNEADESLELEDDEEEPHISEFRCQVKDCSRIFLEVPHLMQHYLRLHEFTIDKVGDLLSVIRLGRFTCGHEGCTVSFTAFWKYVSHIKEQHKDIKLSKPENMYKCEIEGCDRAYATKSNMLRHLMKKHNDYYQQRQPKQEDGVKQNSKTQYQLNKTSDGKENIESNKTSPQKDMDSKRTRKIHNYWTKYEKPVLKSNVEASAMCTKSYPLQYPCMIKGCESVMNSEKSILKHYTVHGLSDKFLEQHRSHYIFCKKFPRQKNGSVKSNGSKSDPSSDSEPELTGHNGTEETQLEGSKPFLRKRTSPIIPAALLDSLSNDDSSDGSLVIKRKRGRPKRIVEKIVKRKKVSHPTKESQSRGEGSNSTVAQSVKETEQPASLAAFKPMGFEMSFLKFLEQSNKTQPSFSCEIPLIGPWVRLSQLNTKETCVKFNNPQNLKSLDKVKIVVDKTFVGATELMLKQLQDMHPMVLLEKK